MPPETPAADVENVAHSAPAPFWPALNRRGQGWLGNFGALAAVLLFLAVVAASFWYLRQEEAHREQEAVKRDVEYAEQRLRLRLLERQEQVMRLAHEVAAGEVRQTRWFYAHAEALMAQYPGLLALSWIDANQHVLATRASPSVSAPRTWTNGQNLLRGGETEAGFAQARALRLPVYAQPITSNSEEPILQLHVPLLERGQFVGELLAEYSIDALLRYDVPAEVLAKYAGALLNSQGHLLAGQSIPDRPALNTWLPWAGKANAYALPVAPVGPGLVLRAQAWRTSQNVLGSALFWLAAALSTLTVWVLLVNWRQTRRRQQAQAALQAETSFRRAIENSMLTGMRALDLDGRIIYVNPAFCQMTGWSERELLGRTEPFPYWPPEDRQALSIRLHQELAGIIVPQGFQMRIRRKNGSIFDARLYVSPLMDATRKQRGWIASITDITEPSRVRQQLAAANARFTNVLEALDASVSVAPMGSTELLYANHMYRQWFDDATSAAGHLLLLTRAGTPENTAAAATSDDNADELAGLPTGSLAASQPERAEVYVEQLGKWLEVRSRYLNWVDGRLAQMVIATDITARRQAEELAAAQAERAQTSSRLIAVGEMASSVAHELNQPLTAITNYCTGMIARVQDGALEQGELLSALEKTARQAQRAGQVVQRIRDLVQRSAPRRSATEVSTIVEQTVELAEAELRRRQVRLERHVAADLPPIMVDPILIEQVLLNLIKNGAESIDIAQCEPARRRVELRVQAAEVEDAPVVQFDVTDTGAGIAPEAFGRLYEVFFSTKREGLGIGLNLCRSIIESHQGRIQAENLYNDGRVAGCRFTFWIPV